MGWSILNLGFQVPTAYHVAKHEKVNNNIKVYYNQVWFTSKQACVCQVETRMTKVG